MRRKMPKARARGKGLGRPEGSSGRETRTRLLDIAATLFALKGFSGVTLADVAGAAGLTGPSIYNHFSSKDELFVAAVASMYEGLASRFAEALDQDVHWKEAIRQLLHIFEEIYREETARGIHITGQLGAVAQLEADQSPDRFSKILDARNVLHQVFRDLMARALQRGELPEGTDPGLAGDLLLVMVPSAIGRVTYSQSSPVEFTKITSTFEVLFLSQPSTPGKNS